MSSLFCTPPPPVPPGGPSDWAAAVYGNCFANLQRLGRWVRGTRSARSGESPAPFFQSVAAGGVGGGTRPVNVYVVVHGWAPGYRAAVQAQGGRLLWWSDAAAAGGRWAADWAWVGVQGADPALVVNGTGLLQSIVANDPAAIVLAYSWIDNSATDGSFADFDQVYRSEAHTNINGLRLAAALETALAPSFWQSPASSLRLIGHSHGAKVATVAALTLERRGRRVNHLTLLDPPEGEAPLAANAANLLGFYLEQLTITDPRGDQSRGTFVDNYASIFGKGYAGTPNLERVVEVALQPSRLYSVTAPGDRHTYAAAWYGAAAQAARIFQQPPLGLAWPPPPVQYQPALNQTWPTGTTQPGQWILQTGASLRGAFSYAAPTLAVSTRAIRGNVTGTAAAGLLFTPVLGAPGTASVFQGGYRNSLLADGYGLAFDCTWTGAQAGDYLVVTAQSPDTREQEVVLVLDGRSAPQGQFPVAFNANVSSLLEALTLVIYYVPAANNSIGRVLVSNFRSVMVTTASAAAEVAPILGVVESTA
jgi:hypothetical protein